MRTLRLIVFTAIPFVAMVLGMILGAVCSNTPHAELAPPMWLIAATTVLILFIVCILLTERTDSPDVHKWSMQCSTGSST